MCRVEVVLKGVQEPPYHRVPWEVELVEEARYQAARDLKKPNCPRIATAQSLLELELVVELEEEAR